ncbi:MAG: hypothetical protein D9V47_04285 [Clostridia bacterium]|nr:MAG: hypothetical protein D9V47_04285 [Clostridia bacterium]
MAVIYLAGVVLLALFSVLVAWYLTGYKFAVKNLVGRALAFAGLAVATFAVVTVLAVFVVWPPFWPL